MSKLTGTFALVGLVLAIGFAETSVVASLFGAVMMAPYIVYKAHQPLEEESSC